MRSINLLSGLLLTGILVLEPDTSFARGGGGGGHLGGGHVDGFHGGFGAVAHGFHGPIAQGEHGERAWHSDGGWSRHSYHRYYGYYSPFAYGLDPYVDPYYNDNDSFDAQQASTDVAPDNSASLTMSVQRELSQLGYYHGPIDGVAGSETEQAVRWFQSIDHLPVTGQIDGATLQALHIA